MKAPQWSVDGRTTILGLILAGAAVAACASTPPPEPKEAEPEPGTSVEAVRAEAVEADSQPEASSPESKAYADMTPPEKMAFMKEVLTPEMAKVFQAADPEHYADFACSTCHGKGAASGNFAMPSPDLPLSAEDKEKHPEITKFMKEEVVPKTAALLQEEPFNPETKEGFGCYDCHTKE